jgi:thiol:disulfide interchange protein
LGGALRQASRTNRLVVVAYWSAFDAQCQEMDRDVFSTQEVHDSLADTIPVRLASWSNRKFAESYGITQVPSFVVLGPDGRVQRIMQGYMSEGRFRGMIEAVKLNQ